MLLSAFFGGLALFWAACGAWHAWRLHAWRRLPVAALGKDHTGEVPPLVSILLPARDEADRMLGECVSSLLAQRWPALEIVAVDDHSTDATGAILRGLAQKDARLRVLSAAPLPRGWRGKPWALQQALEACRGDWLLLTDADVFLAPGLLGDAMRVAQTENWDAVTLAPRFGVDNFWVRAALPVYEWTLVFGLPFVHRDGAGDEKGSACGAFFLLRREALRASGGFAGVAALVTEDVALARRVKGAGFRLTYQRADDRFWTPHYTSGRQLLRGWAKNLWTPRFGVANGLLAAFAILLIALGPVAGALAGGLAGRVAALCQLLAFAPAYVGPGKGWFPWRVLFAPFALAIQSGLIVATIWGVRRGRGLTWKGRALYEDFDVTRHDCQFDESKL